MCSDLKSSVLKDGRRQKKNGKIGCRNERRESEDSENDLLNFIFGSY